MAAVNSRPDLKQLGMHAIAVVAILGFWALSDDPRLTLILGGAAALAVFLIITLREALASALRLTPISCYGFFLALSLGVCPLLTGIWYNADDVLPFVTRVVTIRDVASGYALYALGSLFLHAGLQLFRPKETGEPLSPPGDMERSASLLIAWLAGLPVTWLASRLQSVGTLATSFQMLTLAAACAFALNPPRPFAMNPVAYWTALIAASAGVFVAHVAIGLKFFILLALLPIVWTTFIRRRRRWFVFVLLPITFVGYYAIVEPVVTTARNRRIPDESQAAAIWASFTEQVPARDIQESSILEDSIKASVNRFFPAIPVGFFIDHVRTHDLQHGATMEYMAFAFIPRMLWASKPTVTRGRWFTYFLGGIVESHTTATALTPVGELYWNFGVLGVVAGMFVLGCLFSGLLWRLAAKHVTGSPVRMLLYLNAILLTCGEMEAGVAVVTACSQYIVVRLAMWMLDCFRFERGPVFQIHTQGTMRCLPRDAAAFPVSARMPGK